MIHPERIQPLNDEPDRPGDFVLYWMQASQRAECNHALEYAVRQANRRSQPVVVAFGLTDDYPEANERHYAFLLEGLAETQAALAGRGVQMVVRRGPPEKVAVDLAERASLLVADRGYLRHQRAWRDHVGRHAPCRAVQVETDVVVPVQAASDKEEYAARTIRPKLCRQWERFLVPLRPTPARRDSLGLRLESVDIRDGCDVLAGLKVDGTVARTRRFVGGAGHARTLLGRFIQDKLADYAGRRNDPSLDIQSHMSPYLHFGQVSPLEIALAVRESNAGAESQAAYLEELLVRRELAVNFVFHNARYDAWESLPHWARTTLKAHARDRREHVYGPDDLAASRTHDPYWNAAMTEMRLTGKMHNYMRMYWGKKVLEWTRSPRRAMSLLLELNNRYFLDGRDPASYTNVAWCFGKHDRPWKERPIFGTVRYMNAAGLKRKFHIDDYVRQVELIAARR
ncbi:MAG TPA: deoxyribodipyrimidine photo-lyase [Phycisphaerae bacterium]|nr:deoxyribodipyrimidine photo-lyase [Phycisphaerae bacterium]